MRRLGMPALVLALAACTTVQERLSTWVGLPADRLVMEWGPPQSTYQLENGDLVMQWQSSRMLTIPGIAYRVPQTSYTNGSLYGYGGTAMYSGVTTTYATTTTPSYNVPLSCTIRMLIGTDRRVKDYYAEGNC